MSTATGSALPYVGGLAHRPIPTAQPGTRPTHSHRDRPRVTGLDWSAHTPACRGCGEKSGQLDRTDRCPTCRGDAPAPGPAPTTAVGRDATFVELQPEDLERRFNAPTTTPEPEQQPEPAATPALPREVLHTLDRLADLLMTATQAVYTLRAQMDHIGIEPPPEPDPPHTPKPKRRRSGVGGRGGPVRIQLPAADVVADYRDGLTLAQVGEKYGVSHMTIRRVLEENGVQSRKRPASRTVDREEVRRLYVDERLGTAVVARRLNISATSVARVLREQGVELRPTGVTANPAGARNLATTQARLDELGVTGRQVKEWGVEHGLIDHIARGMPARTLIEAYADAHQEGDTA